MKTLLFTAISLLALTSGAALAGDGDRNLQASKSTRLLGELIYRAAGARDNSTTANTGLATSISCSNFTGADAQVQIVLRNYNFTTTNFDARTFTIPKNSNRTYSSHGTNWMAEDYSGPGGFLNQGTLMIRSESRDVHCSAWIVDAASSSVAATPLHLVRFNAAAGSDE